MKKIQEFEKIVNRLNFSNEQVYNNIILESGNDNKQKIRRTIIIV